MVYYTIEVMMAHQDCKKRNRLSAVGIVGHRWQYYVFYWAIKWPVIIKFIAIMPVRPHHNIIAPKQFILGMVTVKKMAMAVCLFPVDKASMRTSCHEVHVRVC